MELEFVFKWFRNCISVLAWVWAVIVFIIGYYGVDFEHNNNNNEERQPGFRQFFIPIVKILVVAPSMCSFGATGSVINRKERQQAALNDPATVHYVSMNHDGQYSFGYTGSDSSRQERRNSDGSVEGKYSYLNPDGKLVQVEYQADAARGFNAYGDNLPPRQTASALFPVQETQAVKDARERFMETYARELARINAAGVQKLHQAEVSEVPQPVPSAVAHTKTAASPQKPNAQVQQFDDSEVVVAAIEEPEVQKNPNAPYSGGAAFEWNKNPVPFKESHAQPPHQAQYHGVGLTKGQQSGPAYFYYVGVGGTPYYVTSPLRTSTNIAVSVRASQLGARPVDAVHDAQVPRYGYNTEVRHSQPSPPLYVEVGKDYQLPTAHPQFHQVQVQQGQNQGQGHGSVSNSNSNGGFNLPFMGYPVYILQN